MRVDSMFHTRALLVLSLLLVAAPVFAQADAGEKNATPEDIQGEWQLLPMPDAMQFKVLQFNPWPSECQYFSYTPTGDLRSIEKLKAPCDVISAAQLREKVKSVPIVASWKYDFSDSHHKGILIITRRDKKDYMEVWEPHVVDKAFAKGGEQFIEGDLILYLADMESKQLVWVRHLRKLS
jgi:hypothetical protein